MTRARGRRLFSALADVLVDDDGQPPCSPPDQCPTCLLFAQRRAGESTVEHGRRLFAAMLRAEARRTMREARHA